MDDAQRLIDALHASHDRVVGLVRPLDAKRLEGPSYCDSWTIAQVLSHLGSGAEIALLLLEAGRSGDDAPGQETYRAIWGRWDAKSSSDQAADSIDANARLLDAYDALDEDSRSSLRIPMFGRELDLASAARTRLSEHALHAFDVAVALDDEARVAPDAVELLIDTVPGLASFVGKASGQPVRRAVVTSEPERGFLVEADERVQICSLQGDERPDVLHLPAEAFLRLVYGRLDDAHAPKVDEASVPALEQLQALFPGF